MLTRRVQPVACRRRGHHDPPRCSCFGVRQLSGGYPDLDKAHPHVLLGLGSLIDVFGGIGSNEPLRMVLGVAWVLAPSLACLVWDASVIAILVGHSALPLGISSAL